MFPYVKRHLRRTRRGLVTVRSHHRRKSRRPKRNYFYAKKGFFGAAGISKKHGPYATLGVRRRPVKLKTSIGLEGHKASVAVKPAKNSEVIVERNLTFNKTDVKLRHKNKKIEI